MLSKHFYAQLVKQIFNVIHLNTAFVVNSKSMVLFCKSFVALLLLPPPMYFTC
uniref:Uncharacterized protein n=1 Tax=Papilio xuthus TaxID=66420 RepID=I4DQQ2_PAPXU|nr:unknown unsecreted protein [Papilio xuthus]